MKKYSLFDKSGSAIVQNVTLEIASSRLPAGSRLVSGSSKDKEGNVIVKAVYSTPNGRKYELVEVESLMQQEKCEHKENIS